MNKLPIFKITFLTLGLIIGLYLTKIEMDVKNSRTHWDEDFKQEYMKACIVWAEGPRPMQFCECLADDIQKQGVAASRYNHFIDSESDWIAETSQALTAYVNSVRGKVVELRCSLEVINGR